MAQTIDEIKTTAAAIRDATEIGENTASRVGSSVYDLAVYAENTSSTLSPMVQEMYDEFTEARDVYYIDLANVFSCVGHLCGSLNTDALPALKVTDEGEKGYSITLWQDGDTYRGANIPLSSAKNNGLMSAEQADDLATLWDNAVWSEDGKGLSTNDYTDADKANVAKIPSIESTAENTSSILSPMVQEMYDEFTEARDVYYIDLANVFSCVGHLCGSLNTDALPALKVTDEGEKGYSITLWQDGDTYRGANIPLSSAKNNGLMSAEQADDLATLWDNAVWSEDGKGLSTNDYTDADKAKLASISVPSSGIDLSALNSRIGMQSDNIFPPFDGMQSTAIILNTDTYDGEGTTEADAVMFYETKLCFIASIGTRWYTRWKNLANVPDSTAYQYTYLNKRPLVHNSSRTLYVWDGDTSLLPITHQWQVLTSAQYEKLQYKDANTFYYILEDD